MATATFLTRIIPLPLRRRRQPGENRSGRRNQAATSAVTSTNSSSLTSAFTILGFRAIDPATSQYQTLLNQIRHEEQFPFTMAPEVDPSDPASPPRKKAKIASEPTLSCRVCFCEIDGPYLTPCRSCKRPQCLACVKHEFIVALADHERMPVRCCDQITYHDVAKDVLPPAELLNYKTKYDESSTSNPFYCPIPTCSAFISPRILKSVQGKVMCHLCNTAICFKCRQVSSDNHKCAEVDEKTQILKKFHYKLCPRCGTGIMRMYGCAHVRCQCGAHWCWDCQRPINACYLKPCSAARDEGDESEADGADAESELEEESIVQGPALENSTEELSTQAQPPRVGQPTTSPDANTISEASQESEAPADNPVTETKETETAAPAEEPIVNLDDPDGSEHEWEAGEYDFGDEPSDEQLDVWGCMHRYRDFRAENVPKKWMVSLNVYKPITLECMSCFKPIKINGRKQIEAETEVNEMPSAPTDKVTDEETADEDELEAKLKKYQKRQARKTGAFDCRTCGVVHCWECRRAAVRKAAEHRNSGLV